MVNVEACRTVSAHIDALIETDPLAFDMDVWASKSADNPSACGTTACIAGWTMELLGGGLKWRNIDHWHEGDCVAACLNGAPRLAAPADTATKAREILDIPTSELFYLVQNDGIALRALKRLGEGEDYETVINDAYREEEERRPGSGTLRELLEEAAE